MIDAGRLWILIEFKSTKEIRLSMDYLLFFFILLEERKSNIKKTGQASVVTSP